MSHSGVMVALFPTAEQAAELAGAGTEKRRDIHLTLAFLGDASKMKDLGRLKNAVKGFAATCPPISGSVSGTGYFTAADENVAYASADLPDLPEHRERLVDLLRRAGFPPASDHGFTPHLTLGYGQEDVAAITAKPGMKLTFNTITLAIADRRVSFPLEGSALSESDDDHAARVARLTPQLEEGEFSEGLHPRDRMGRFRDIVGRLHVGGHVTLPGARVDHIRRHEYRITDDEGKVYRGSSPRIATEFAAAASARSTHPDALGGPKKYKTTMDALAAPQPDFPSAAEQDHMYRSAQDRDAEHYALLAKQHSPIEIEALRDRVEGQGGYIGDRTALELLARRRPA